MKEPTFDADGYPTEETIQYIEKYDLRNGATLLVEFILKAWHWDDYAQWNPPKLELHTGGWSGNECIVRALEENFVFWNMFWQKSERGGHYYFTVR